MLNLALGTETLIDGELGILTAKGRSGHALFGPYERVAPGQYVVEFYIDSNGVTDLPDEICAVVDVIADQGTTDIAFDYVLLSQVVSGAPVRLAFDLTNFKEVEYRVHVSGVAPLRIRDRVDVALRKGGADQKAALLTADDRTMLRTMYQAGVRVDLRDDDIVMPARHLPAFAAQVLRLEQDRQKLAQRVVEAVGYRGDPENSLYRAFIGTERAMVSPPQPIPFSSTLCQQAHFGYDQYRFWTSALKETPKFQRKQWEFVFIAQVLFERGFLETGRRGLVFGAGQEQLPALFASFGCKIVASDQDPAAAVEGGWIESGQHTYDLDALNQRSICTDRMFRELVSYQSVDMNDIPSELNEQFDFCWSACAFEHLGSLDKGLAFVEASLNTLRPGGVAVHTTEYNLSSNDDTVETNNLSIYRRRDIEHFVEAMISKGFEVAPIDWTEGEGFAEMVVDLPPFAGRGEPHIRLRSGQYDTTSIGLIIRKPADPHREATA